MQKQKQTRALDRGADIIVATPGRALDHLRRKTLGLDALLVLVLDEADEMLDMGIPMSAIENPLEAPPPEEVPLKAAPLVRVIAQLRPGDRIGRRCDC